ncbi:MAG: NAD(P)H-binding protein [Acidobacteria bacterium]|nr:NAD(P)H-binding protein [Acidobacteriota bacterium]MBV9070636.1 NAD(P)H-binding protein [Acidobacteriota bacterium]MBV9478177.1 NAD(P)H-binding protein [Acidobacteriota bacterium]
MNVFLTGASGYLASRLIPELLSRGHTVRGLVRRGSERKLPRGAEAVVGDALDASTYSHAIAPSDTFVHLVGVAHPSPAKAAEFRSIDLVSIRQAVHAVRGSSVRHFVYLSVAQPAPAMCEYVAVRAEGERLVRDSALAATFVRPWYVLGPGHRWPYLLLPAYWIWGAFPSQRDTARRLYPVKLADVVRAMADAIEHPPSGVRVIEAPELRAREPLTPARVVTT